MNIKLAKFSKFVGTYGRWKIPNISLIFYSPIVLDRSNYITKLRVKETLQVAKRQPQLNAVSQPLSVFLLNVYLSFLSFQRLFVTINGLVFGLILLLHEMCFVFDLCLCCISCLCSAVTTRRLWDCSLSLHHTAIQVFFST